MTRSPPDTSALLEELIALPAEQRLPHLRRAGDAGELIVALGNEAERLAFSEIARAMRATEAVVELADEIGQARGRARGRRARAQTLSYAGRHEEALTLCGRAIEIAEQSGEAVEAARARLASMHALGELGRYDEAIERGEQARELLLGAGRPELAARADLNLGAVHQNRDAPARALLHLDRAADALQAEPELLGYVENNRGEALLLLSRFAHAERAFIAARDACEKCNANLIAALAEGNLADLAARRGLLTEAMRHFEIARRRFEQDGAQSHLARLLSEQAEAYEALGLPHDAIAVFNDALPRLAEHGLAAEAARAQAGLGKCLVKIGKLDDAEAALMRAGDQFTQLKNPVAAARSEVIRAEVALAQGRNEAALALLEHAEPVLADRPADAVLVRHLMGRVAAARGDLSLSNDELTAAIELARRMDIAPMLADLLHARGNIRRAQRDADAARHDLREAVTQIERVRGTLQADRFRSGFLGDRLGVYEDLVSVELERDAGAASIFGVIEQAKSRTLLEAVQGRADDLDDADEDREENRDDLNADRTEGGLRKTAARLRGELNALYSRLADAADRDVDDAWREKVRLREQELRSVEHRLASARGVGALYAAPPTLDQVCATLGEGTVLVEYFLVRDELIAIVAGSDDVEVIRDLADRAWLEDRVTRLQFQLNRATRIGQLSADRAARLLRDVRRELQALWERIAGPFERRLASGRRLIVVPHGPLHGVPFHALWDGGRYLIERVEVAYCPSAGILVQLSQTPPRGRGTLIVGSSDEVAPQISEEVRALAGALPDCTTLLDEQGTAEQALEGASGKSVIHFACHGRFSSRNPLSSGLVLNDRLLTLHDICGMHLDAELVTLSGCDTGRSLVQAGDELLGLMRGFFSAGAASLMVSLWPAHDESASKFMQDYYRMWLGSGADVSKSCAVREAQLASLARDPHPVYWAPFVLVGKP